MLHASKNRSNSLSSLLMSWGGLTSSSSNGGSGISAAGSGSGESTAASRMRSASLAVSSTTILLSSFVPGDSEDGGPLHRASMKPGMWRPSNARHVIESAPVQNVSFRTPSLVDGGGGEGGGGGGEAELNNGAAHGALSAVFLASINEPEPPTILLPLPPPPEAAAANSLTDNLAAKAEAPRGLSVNSVSQQCVPSSSSWMAPSGSPSAVPRANKWPPVGGGASKSLSTAEVAKKGIAFVSSGASVVAAVPLPVPVVMAMAAPAAAALTSLAPALDDNAILAAETSLLRGSFRADAFLAVPPAATLVVVVAPTLLTIRAAGTMAKVVSLETLSPSTEAAAVLTPVSVAVTPMPVWAVTPELDRDCTPSPGTPVTSAESASQRSKGKNVARSGIGAALALAAAPPIPSSSSHPDTVTQQALSRDTRGRTLKVDDFDLLRVVGKGSYGKVLLVRLRGPAGDAEGPLAMKVLSKAHVVARRQVEHTQAERVILEAVDHPFLQRLRFAFQAPEALFLVTRFLPGGELFHHLRAAGHFSEDLTRFYAAEVALALHHLHSLDVVYRDLKVRRSSVERSESGSEGVKNAVRRSGAPLKAPRRFAPAPSALTFCPSSLPSPQPENILLDEAGHVRLTDFGLSKVLAEGSTTTKTFCGTPEYLAPEMVEGKPHGKAIDWWALGVLIYEMLEGVPPWSHANSQSLYRMILTAPLLLPASFSPAARALIKALLSRSPETRLSSFSALQESAFFQGVDWDRLMSRRATPPWQPPVSAPDDVSNFEDFSHRSAGGNKDKNNSNSGGSGATGLMSIGSLPLDEVIAAAVASSQGPGASALGAHAGPSPGSLPLFDGFTYLPTTTIQDIQQPESYYRDAGPIAEGEEDAAN